MNPPVRANTLTTAVLMPIPYLQHLYSDGHGSSFPPWLLRGSFLNTSSGRLRRTPTKVRLNRSQRHRLKGRFWWFIGVYSRSKERIRMRILPKERKVSVAGKEASYRSSLSSRAWGQIALLAERGKK